MFYCTSNKNFQSLFIDCVIFIECFHNNTGFLFNLSDNLTLIILAYGKTLLWHGLKDTKWISAVLNLQKIGVI